ncbi:superoxide dismutase family protein [Pseudogracilibacillus auburnensis]|uniref:Cu-Zn family superoxide dismutase n=1 Tax=Pseudogracilibacillus auburnensis TaxID=1494959 RepID=A0A2V3VKX6_9BACI|nr:superoxide dismutase family protein [Pseudogracilibacillus auburnensis]MBO1005012.1 superoxide dismutase family protein [Pseudogracilibacillus auburnensis]PXW81418.1 Cu-Zn family superoxide dismutase [Pseudogracilibacillus auburnensis]
MRFFIVIISIFLLSSCHLMAKPKTAIKVDMYNTTGDMVGTANLTEDPKGVKIKLKLEGLTPGFHGLHIHEVAKCEQPDFKSAGNHFNPENKKHGLLHPKGAHLGDLKNIEADHNGAVDVDVLAPDATLLKGSNKSLTDQGGTSLIVTSEPDDGMSQISGNSGDRIICGEIKENKNEIDQEKPTDPTDKKDEKKK